MTTFGANLCNIRCECGHEADFMDFARTPVAGELPPGRYQCPACRAAWSTAAEIKPWGAVGVVRRELEAL